jgi:hypothetical protein
VWVTTGFVSVAAGALFIALDWPMLWRIAALGHFAATIMIVRALWLVRHGMPRQSPATGLPLAARPPFAT